MKIRKENPKRETEGGKYTRERKIPINKREEDPQGLAVEKVSPRKRPLINPWEIKEGKE